ncbi:MAG: hypothetical protein Q8K32_21730 [Archangium sp.]|nr:hypothetical protein [Archangium sp.]
MTLALVLIAFGAVTEETPAAVEPVTPAVEQKKALGVTAGAFEVKVAANLRLAQTMSSTIVLDDLGTAEQPTPFEMRVRLGPEIKFHDFSLISEFDVATGAVFGTPDSTVVAARVPTPTFSPAELRQLYLQYRWTTGAARLGVQTSNFGLGMLANAGARDGEAGDFGIQHGGAVVARAAVLGRPFYALGGAWKAVEPIAAFDLVVRDATANLLEGDRALQGILGLRFNVDDDHQVGLTAIYRSQRREGGAPGERSTDAFVADLFARWTVMKTADSSLTLSGELAAITGTTTQSRSDTAEVLDVRQLGVVAKVNYKKGRFGVLFDGGFASGDQNPYDTTLSNFRFDSNYKVGLILFDQVLGYQSARSGWRGADPSLTGVAPEGIDLLPSAGAVTGAWYLFPRAKYGFADWIDVYGGPLFAFTSAALTDPFNTRLNGGTPVNYLGGTPGNYLGTELDLGVSVHAAPTPYLNVSATLEGGVLLPGDAFRTAAGSNLGAVGVGRLRLSASL